MTSVPPLTDIYTKRLNELLTAEKKYLKSFLKMATAALTEELRRGLSPSLTDQERHIERLQQCKALVRLKGAAPLPELDVLLLAQAEKALKTSTKQTLSRDIEMLHCSQTILSVRITVYQSLQHMAMALQQDHAALLLEQCFKDNQNSSGYLTQISQNIIYPNYEIQIGNAETLYPEDSLKIKEK